MQLYDQGVSALSDHEQELLAAVDRSLEVNLRLFSWWKKVDTEGCFEQRCEIETGDGFLFFDGPEINGHQVQVMGCSQELLHTPNEQSDQDLRRLVLDEFLRMGLSTSATRPEPSGPRFVYSQHYFKCRDGGALGKFAAEERNAIIDLQDLGETFSWIVLEVEIPSDLQFDPLAIPKLSLQIPFTARQWVVLIPELIIDRATDEVTYGLGYALFRDPNHRSLLGHGPGNLEIGFQLFRFHRLDSGDLRTRMVFLTQGVERVLDLGIGFDPLSSLAWLIQFLTFGWASRYLGISKRGFEKAMLRFHCKKHQEVLVGYLKDRGWMTVSAADPRVA